MSLQYESTPETKLPTHNTHVIDYPVLVEAVQLSVARLLNMQGAAEANTFKEVIADKSLEEQERIICEIGARFDDALINLVTVALVAQQRQRRMVILAEKSDGIDGVLPWQPKLVQHLQSLREQGYLQNSHVDIERYSSEDIESLTRRTRDLALESA